MEVLEGTAGQFLANALVLDDEIIDIAFEFPNASTAVQVAHERLRPMFPLQRGDQGADDLRIKLLLGDINDLQFDKGVDAMYRKTRHCRDVGRVIETFTFAGLDIVQKAIQMGLNEDILKELKTLRDVVNNELILLSEEHGRKVPFLDSSWVWKIPYR